MKFQTTAKYIRNYYSKIICIGYCNLQFLLNYENPTAYTAGVYGWNADIYEINDICICTGYRPFGNITPDYETTRKYDDKARAIINAPYNHKTIDEYYILSETRREQLKTLLNEFITEVLNNANK